MLLVKLGLNGLKQIPRLRVIYCDPREREEEFFPGITRDL